ncbi:uncharacterized protein LOC109823346 [Asparagus officinalis]|uniref:uncharacterized protein LOC109823346 n=1 Tax=Asparagus officinalis TaxID=4686 RepID=UPI00098E3801|nr:uncharacterized protein LOC109823346 [Asparagus officinalis]
MERFTRVFCAFGPAIKGFTFCRPLLSIDGAHLYDKYKGVLLVATDVDANGGLFPLAFAVVEVEDTSSWKWYFELIYKWIPSVRVPRLITFISDRMKGIIRALHEGFGAPHYHRYCLRRIRDNFKKKHVYEHYREKIKSLSLDAHNWIEHNLKPQFEHRWALCKDEGVRFCMMTTNCSESFNGVLKGARAMPIQSLVARTFYRLNSYFNKRREDGVDWTTRYTPKNESILHRRIEAARLCQITVFNDNEWQVHDYDGIYTVKLFDVDCTCTCNIPQLQKIPCAHVLAASSNQLGGARIPYNRYCSPWYSTIHYRKTYSKSFHPPDDSRYWSEYTGPRLIPP